MTDRTENDLGPQPLEKVMQDLKLTAHDLVGASTKQLTFKMVSKGCKGRRLTPNVQQKILEALNHVRPEAKLKLKDIFNY